VQNTIKSQHRLIGSFSPQGIVHDQSREFGVIIRIVDVAAGSQEDFEFA
jgi:hypothetical protein